MSVLVAAAVIIEDGRVLLTQRKRGTHLAGSWEFPGGKVERDEDPREALVREIREEIGVDITVGEPVEITFHRYPEKSVLLLFFEARRLDRSKAPEALDVAAIRWARSDDLDAAAFPPADVAILSKVRDRLGRA